MKEEDAIDEMEKLGLKYEIVRVRTNNIEKGIVYKMIPDGGSVVMADGSTVEVSRRKKEELLSMMM